MSTFNDYIVFIDESGDHGLESIDPNYPVFVLAFCLFKKDVYANQVVPSILKFKFNYFGHENVILRERDIRKTNPPFGFLRDALKREPFFHDLNMLIEQASFTLVASYIDKESLDKQYLHPENPYHIAMKFGLERIYSHLFNLGCQLGTTYFIFEARGKLEDKDLELEFRRACAKNTVGRALPFEIVLADKRCNSPGLQLADLVARPIGRRALKPSQPNRAYEIIKTKFRTDNEGNIEGWGLKKFP